MINIENDINTVNRLMAEAEVIEKFGRDHWISQTVIQALEEFRKLERTLPKPKK